MEDDALNADVLAEFKELGQVVLSTGEDHLLKTPVLQMLEISPPPVVSPPAFVRLRLVGERHVVNWNQVICPDKPPSR